MLHRLFLRHRCFLLGKEITDCLILIYEWFGKVYNEWDQKYEVIIVKKCTVERETSEKQIPEKKTAETEFKTLWFGIKKWKKKELSPIVLILLSAVFGIGCYAIPI